MRSSLQWFSSIFLNRLKIQPKCTPAANTKHKKTMRLKAVNEHNNYCFVECATFNRFCSETKHVCMFVPKTMILSICGPVLIPIDGYGLQLFGAFSLDHHYFHQSKYNKEGKRQYRTILTWNYAMEEVERMEASKSMCSAKLCPNG